MFEIVHFQKITFKCWEYSSKFKSIWTVLFVIIFDPLFTATNESSVLTESTNEKPVLYSINQWEERITVCTELQDPRLWQCCHHWLTQESEKIIIINLETWITTLPEDRQGSTRHSWLFSRDQWGLRLVHPSWHDKYTPCDPQIQRPRMIGQHLRNNCGWCSSPGWR